MNHPNGFLIFQPCADARLARKAAGRISTAPPNIIANDVTLSTSKIPFAHLVTTQRRSRQSLPGDGNREQKAAMATGPNSVTAGAPPLPLRPLRYAHWGR